MAPAKFAVLTSSRTGSTWLIDLLNMQPDVEAHGELFLDEPRTTPSIATRSDYPRFIEIHGHGGAMRPVRVFSYLDRLYSPPRAVGFKLMYGQLRRYPEILAFLALRRVRIIHLVRHNCLDIIISEELARSTGSSHVSGVASFEAPKVRLDPATLADRLRKRDRRSTQARWLVRASTCRCVEVHYEALLEGQRELYRIAGFLGITNPVTEVKSSLVKRGVQSHKDALSNYDEVKVALSSTPFSSMLR